jgi:hypothetical protein
MWYAGKKLIFVLLYIIVTFSFGHFSFALAVLTDTWIASHIKFSEVLQNIHHLIHLDQQIWNLLFSILFPFSRRILEASSIESRKLTSIMVVTLSFCFLINFLGLQLN